MKDQLFKNLNDQQKEEFKKWAREHYRPGTPIFTTWHPVVQEECRKINDENGITED